MTDHMVDMSLFYLLIIGIESLLLFLCYRKKQVLLSKLHTTQKSYENRLKHVTSKFEGVVQEQAQRIDEYARELAYLKNHEGKKILQDHVVAGLHQEVETLRKQVEGESTNDTLLVKQTLRSGDRICTAEHLVIVGDVNPGAEIIAGGDVIVLGALRGSVHAGMPAHSAAVVIAWTLQPVQLRIADYRGQIAPFASKQNAFPEIARVVGNQVKIEVLHHKQHGSEPLIAYAVPEEKGR